MLSSSFDISEFIAKVKGHNGLEIIYLADLEATEAERHLHKHAKTKNCENAHSYATLLKDIVLYMRHGIRTHKMRRLDLTQLGATGRDC